ncbi:hypothetical protein [Streptococcus sp. DD12]|uniref:hypothetical protein n=1 Tax=Streptococcus sp. DD12 TaxID=1777880 RepID=UPI00079542CE|nr:hypothetical protein [Streptococcus sp. DD12]KXT76025.1 ABC-type sugar transport system, permease component [Streptococcus sp. DD12]
MNYLTIPFFKALLKKTESKIALAFSFFPLLLIVVGLFNTNFMRLSAPPGSMSFLEFFSAVLSTQYQITLPLVVFIYISSTVFRDEITTGIMYLYKDISRRLVLNAKIGAIILLQFLYIGLTAIMSLITYYLYLIHQPYTSGNFLPRASADIQYTLVSITGTVLVFLLCSMIANLASISFSNGITMLVGIVFALFSFIAPSLTHLRFIFPNGYINVLNNLSFGFAILLTTIVFAVYFISIYVLSLRFYRKLEY